MTPYCKHDPPHASKGQGFSAGECYLCWLYLNHGGYAAQWNGQPIPPEFLAQEKAERPPCKHFGEATGETRLCGECAGKVELKMFACAVHGQCTPATSLPGLACCQGCQDYAPTAPSP